MQPRESGPRLDFDLTLCRLHFVFDHKYRNDELHFNEGGSQRGSGRWRKGSDVDCSLYARLTVTSEHTDTSRLFEIHCYSITALIVAVPHPVYVQ